MADLVPSRSVIWKYCAAQAQRSYGTHAIGGVINAIPDDGSPGLHFTAGFEGGNLSTFRERFGVSGGVTTLDSTSAFIAST
jgi:outer membrane cobalamin receptor